MSPLIEAAATVKRSRPVFILAVKLDFALSRCRDAQAVEVGSNLWLIPIDVRLRRIRAVALPTSQALSAKRHHASESYLKALGPHDAPHSKVSGKLDLMEMKSEHTGLHLSHTS